MRVYRWGAGAAGPTRHVVGVVERVGHEGREAFHSLDELWGILTSRRRSAARKREAEKDHPDFWSVSAGRARSPGRATAKGR